ncbi:MAG TPA: class E sortase [Nitriliruptorales bacterium]
MGVKVIRGIGWTLIGAGMVIVLYLVYLLFYTNLETERAQNELLEQFELEFGPIEQALPGRAPDDPEAVTATAEEVDPGDAYAAIWFERPGSDEPIVHEDPLLVVEGVTLGHLRKGPGHYPETAAPGQQGNFALSGHRTTYGAPFYHLDALREGDLIHVVDRDRTQWVYEFRRKQIVDPRAFWVIGRDPLGTGEPTLTLTTCHPRFSAARRLVVFAVLVDATPAGASAEA